MWNEGVRKSDGERVVYMVYDYEHGPKINWKEVSNFIDRRAKKDIRARYFRNRTLTTTLVWDDALKDFITLKIGYHIIIDENGYVRIFNQPTFERLYEKYLPENIEYVFFNG